MSKFSTQIGNDEYTLTVGCDGVKLHNSVGVLFSLSTLDIFMDSRDSREAQFKAITKAAKSKANPRKALQEVTNLRWLCVPAK